MLVKVGIDEPTSKSTLDKSELWLVFGPVELVPFSKISGYQTMSAPGQESKYFHPASYWKQAH